MEQVMEDDDNLSKAGLDRSKWERVKIKNKRIAARVGECPAEPPQFLFCSDKLESSMGES